MKTKQVVAKDVPESMHRNFKQLCVQHGNSITEAIKLYLKRVEMSSGSIIDEWRAEERELNIEQEQ